MAFCMNCGTRLQEGASFCPECGAQIFAGYRQQALPAYAPDPAWQAAYAAAAAHDRAVGEAQAGIAESDAAYTTHRNRTIACAAAGIALAPFVGAVCAWLICGLHIQPPEREPLLFLLFSISGFLLAFVLCFIWNLAKNHGFFIIFSLPFLTAVLGVLAVVTVPGGIAYAIWNISKCRQAKEAKASWERRLAELTGSTMGSGGNASAAPAAQPA